MKRTKKNQPRRRHDAEFKASALKLIEDGRSVKDVAEGLGIKTSLLYSWRSQAKKKQTKGGFDENIELKLLRKRLKEVEQERDILKKALGIFSRKT